MTNHPTKDREKKEAEKKEAAPFVEIIDKLADSCNIMGLDDKAIAKHMAEAFTRNHNTLQQSSIRLLIEFFREVGKTKFTDARNEGAINWCKKAAEIEEYLPYV